MPELTVPVSAITLFLVETIGKEMLGYVACAEPAEVKDWLDGAASPNPSQEAKLRACFDCTTVICAAYDAETARAWLFGSPVALDQQAPARLIRQLGRHDLDAAAITGAARSFCWA